MPVEIVYIRDQSTGALIPVAVDQLPDGTRAQLQKIMFGADGFGTMVSDTDPLPVASKPKLSGSVTDTVALLAGIAKKVADANANRDSLILSVPSSFAGVVWFSADNAPALGKGMEVQAGGPLVCGRRSVFFTTGEVWAISAADVTLGRVEVTGA